MAGEAANLIQALPRVLFPLEALDPLCLGFRLLNWLCVHGVLPDCFACSSFVEMGIEYKKQKAHCRFRQWACFPVIMSSVSGSSTCQRHGYVTAATTSTHVL